MLRNRQKPPTLFEKGMLLTKLFVESCLVRVLNLGYFDVFDKTLLGDNRIFGFSFEFSSMKRIDDNMMMIPFT